LKSTIWMPSLSSSGLKESVGIQEGGGVVTRAR
jgi:hypothetical protein